MRGRWVGNKITKDQREEILRTYLESPDAGTKLAMSYGLTPAYAYRLANERGLTPLTRHISNAARARA